MLVEMIGNIDFASVFAIGESNEIGLHEELSLGSFWGFSIGTIFANFHICGMMFLFRDRL